MGADGRARCDGEGGCARTDIRDLISVDEVMEELEFGPNGGLVYAMEFLTKNMDWLEEELERYGDDDYLLLDCPGTCCTPTRVCTASRCLASL